MNNTNMYKMVGNFHDADILGMGFLTVNSYFDTINIVLKDRRFLLEYGSEIIKITLSDCSRVKIEARMYICGNDSVRSCWTSNDEVIGIIGGEKSFLHFYLETNITASVVDVYACDVQIERYMPRTRRLDSEEF